MNRVDLVASISEGSGLTLKEANAALAAALEAIAAALCRGEEVHLHGFGAFATRQRQARTIVHPLTKERVAVSPRRTVFFTPAGPLRKRVGGPDGPD